MQLPTRTWQEELAIIDRIMKSVSGISDPEELVSVYWEGVHELFPMEHFLAVSRRGVEPPDYLITRSSRFAEEINPWKERHRLPRMSGGLLGEIAYADRPLVIDDLPSRLRPDDPAHFYLDGFQSLIALPNYENGRGINVGMTLFAPGVEFDRAMVPMMHWQSSLFGRGTLSLVLRNQLSEALAELDRELQVVGQIQRSLLPAVLPSIDGVDIAADYKTSARAGGDYYDFFPIDDGVWGIFIADVSGHGTPAAVLMAITHAIAHTRPGKPQPPGELLAHINRHLTRSYTSSGTFVTAFYATLDVRTRVLTFSSAGHNPPRLRRGDGVRSLDAPGGLPLGIMDDEIYGESSITLERGDVLLLYTDGITEAMAPTDSSGTRELFGVERLDAEILSCSERRAQTTADRVRAAVEGFVRSTPPTDDQTIVAIVMK